MANFDEALIRWLDVNDVAQDVNITKRLTDNLFSLGVREQGQLGQNIYIEALALTVNASANLYNQLATAKTKCYGFIITGETDSVFTLKADANIIGYDQITATRPVAVMKYARPLSINTGQNILMTVTNNGLISANYKGILMLEEVDE